MSETLSHEAARAEGERGWNEVRSVIESLVRIGGFMDSYLFRITLADLESGDTRIRYSVVVSQDENDAWAACFRDYDDTASTWSTNSDQPWAVRSIENLGIPGLLLV